MKQIIKIYQQYLNLQDANFSLIDHEDAMVAIVYKITKTDGTELILKISERPNDFFREVMLLKQLSGKLSVPKIIQIVEPNEKIHSAILMEFLTGELLKKDELTEKLAYEIGESLACIHLNRFTGYGDPIDHHLNLDPTIYFSFKFEEGIKECESQLPIELIKKCQKYYQAQQHILQSVDGPCLAHRDFRPGNLIVENNQLKGIIDWLGARASFAEEDFCSIEHGDWLANSFIKNSFLSGYANIRPVPDYMPFISLLRLNKAIATIGFTVKQGTWKNRNSGIYQANLQFLENFFKDDM